MSIRPGIQALLVLNAALCCALVAGEAAPEKAVRELAVPRKDVPGVGNFAKISDCLYRGEQPTAEGFAQLKKMGVKTIVNLRSFHSDRSKLKGYGLQYVHIYCKAWHPEDEDVLAFLKVMQDPANHPVFVHCQHGADRTGMMVAAYRILEQNWPVEDAAKETHNFGFHKMFKDIQKYLLQFDRERMAKLLENEPSPQIDIVK
ncbi:MAG TPA: dual specificity protein phosphatase family protein [Planctomycetota bacterium]|nr:dual specificity protein phosphatase family protein [Planctomycetota bacterium]